MSLALLSCNEGKSAPEQDASREESAKSVAGEHATDVKNTNTLVAPPSLYNLDHEDIDALKAGALRGDATAAYRIAIYYENVSDPMPKDALDWFHRAAELGHVMAMQRLGFYLYYDERWRNCANSVRWIETSMRPQFAPSGADLDWSRDMLAVVRLDRLHYCS